MAQYIYVDNSNVWIEGKKLAAVFAGLASDVYEASENRISDPGWRIDFGKLFDYINGKPQTIGRAVLFGSKPPPNDSLWNSAASKGSEVIVYPRNTAGKEKKIDVDVATTIIEDSYEKMKASSDEIILVAGDSDYVPMIEKLTKRGFRVKVVFWSHASKELKLVATEFKSLDDHIDGLKHR